MNTIRWRKSARSAQQTNCVELAHTLDAVRDSKNGAVLSLDRAAVVRLLETVRR